jgi:myosin heavy subunit
MSNQAEAKLVQTAELLEANSAILALKTTITMLNEDLDASKEEEAKMNADLNSSKEEEAKMKSLFTRSEMTVAELEAAMRALEEKHAAVEDTVALYESILKDPQKLRRAEAAVERLTPLKAKVEKLTAELAVTERRASTASEQVAKLQSECEKMELAAQQRQLQVSKHVPQVGPSAVVPTSSVGPDDAPAEATMLNASTVLFTPTKDSAAEDCIHRASGLNRDSADFALERSQTGAAYLRLISSGDSLSRKTPDSTEEQQMDRPSKLTPPGSQASALPRSDDASPPPLAGPLRKGPLPVKVKQVDRPSKLSPMSAVRAVPRSEVAVPPPLPEAENASGGSRSTEEGECFIIIYFMMSYD